MSERSAGSRTVTPQPSLLVSLVWPIRDAAQAADVVAPAIGGHPSDVAASLRRCPGFVDLGVDLDRCDAIARDLRTIGLPYYAVNATLVPRPPKPLLARGVDPRGGDHLLAPVAMTGPAEAIPYKSILAAVPVIWQSSSSRALPGSAPKGTNAAKIAMSLATTGGVGLLMARPSGAAATEVVVDGRVMLAIVALRAPGQWQRFHVFADRCDFRVLARLGHDSAGNWRALLADVAARLRPEQAGASLLADAIAGRGGADAWVADDDNHLADRLRWLLLTAMLRRLGAGAGTSA